MKMRLFFYLTALVLLAGCKAWNPSMLAPKDEPITPKLLTLERQIEDLANTTVVANEDELRLFTKEVENNLMDPYGDKYGYIALKRNIVDVKYGMGYFWTSTILVSIPNLFGLPFTDIRHKIEVEIRILDRNNKLVGKYSAIGESSAKAAYYYGYSMSNAHRKSYPDALLDAFDKIRPQIQSDASRLNEKLLEAGKI